MDNQFRIVTSDLILKELATVLSRPKFKTSQKEINKITEALSKTADVVNVRTKIKGDPKDDMLIETALDGEAPIVITGDNHLLALGHFEAIRRISIEEMLTRLKKKADSLIDIMQLAFKWRGGTLSTKTCTRASEILLDRSDFRENRI